MRDKESRLQINLTAPDLAGRIAEARNQIDSWLAGLQPPGPRSGMVQELTLFSLNPLVYEIKHVPRIGTEAVTIL